MIFRTINPDGSKSIDHKVKKLVAYVNSRINQQLNQTDLFRGDWTEEKRIDWARETIETGVKNIAADVFADRIE